MDNKESSIQDYFENLRAICSTDNPLVSTMREMLMMKKRMVIPPKKKNTGYGLPAASITIGVKITQIEHPNQFIIVARGTILAGIIYGT